MSYVGILTAVKEIHDLALEHDVKLGPIRLTLGRARDLYHEITWFNGKQPDLHCFLAGEHHQHDGVHLMWDRPS